MYKVIFHLNEEEKTEDALRNIKNLLEDMKNENERIDIELLAHSRGVNAFKKTNKENKEEIKNLLEKGLEIALCKNSLITLNLKKEDFIEEAIIVSSGVGELTKKQNEGWSYIKP